MAEPSSVEQDTLVVSSITFKVSKLDDTVDDEKVEHVIGMQQKKSSRFHRTL